MCCNCFFNACKNGRLEEAQKLFKRNPVHCNRKALIAFQAACHRGHLACAQWMYAINPCLVILTEDASSFRGACNNGHLAVAQWLYAMKHMWDISAEKKQWVYKEAFAVACMKGHLVVGQWLYDMEPTLDFSHENELVFRFACNSGLLSVAQYLYALKPTLDISAKNDQAFRMACTNGYLAVAQWLFKIKPMLDISAFKEEYAFRVSCWVSCSNSQMAVAHWLKTILVLGTEILTEMLEKVEIECSICKHNNIDIQTNCKHNYCTDCITKWYAQCQRCPYCRTSLKTFNKIVLI